MSDGIDISATCAPDTDVLLPRQLIFFPDTAIGSSKGVPPEPVSSAFQEPVLETVLSMCPMLVVGTGSGCVQPVMQCVDMGSGNCFREWWIMYAAWMHMYCMLCAVDIGSFRNLFTCAVWRCWSSVLCSGKCSCDSQQIPRGSGKLQLVVPSSSRTAGTVRWEGNVGSFADAFLPIFLSIGASLSTWGTWGTWGTLSLITHCTTPGDLRISQVGFNGCPTLIAVACFASPGGFSRMFEAWNCLMNGVHHTSFSDPKGRGFVSKFVTSIHAAHFPNLHSKETLPIPVL